MKKDIESRAVEFLDKTLLKFKGQLEMSDQSDEDYLCAIKSLMRDGLVTLSFDSGGRASIRLAGGVEAIN